MNELIALLKSTELVVETFIKWCNERDLIEKSRSQNTITYIGDELVFQLTNTVPKWKMHQSTTPNKYYAKFTIEKVNGFYLIISNKYKTFNSIEEIKKVVTREEYAIIRAIHFSYVYLLTDDYDINLQSGILYTTSLMANDLGLYQLENALDDMSGLLYYNCVIDFKIDNLLYNENEHQLLLFDVMYN